MKSLPKINPGYLNYINENENLYVITPIEVKRQIWCLNSGKSFENDQLDSIICLLDFLVSIYF